MHSKIYHVKVLDFKYQPEFEHLTFRYLTYEVDAEHQEEAVKKARESYMKGRKAISSEELPFLLKTMPSITTPKLDQVLSCFVNGCILLFLDFTIK